MPVLAFGRFTIDPQSGQLLRDGEPVALPPQPARLLLALLERPGELVTREELRQKVWDDRTFVDYERGLNFCVLQVRSALGDDAKSPRFIETLPKRGYRFIAPIAAIATSTPPLPAVMPRRRAGYAVAASAVLALVLLFAAWQRRASVPVPHPTVSLGATSPAAHDAYLRGRQLWQERTTPAVLASVDALREAIRIEPRYVLAHIALAESLHTLAMRERIEPRDAAVEIRRASREAVRLAPAFAQSHATAAMLHFWYDWQWDAAEASYRRAIQLDPNVATALHDHGWLLISQGSWDAGIAEIRRAQELDPLSPRANAHVAWAYIYTRQYANAIAEARRALTLDPEFREAYACLEHAHLLSGDYTAALAARQKRLGTKLVVRDPKTYWTRELAREAEERVTADDAERDPYSVAASLAMAGRPREAITWLAKAKEQRSTSFPLAGVDPKLASLHGDATFDALLRTAGLTPRGL
jgi:DNA-binding winged helix-turn-helix (wHTH) protein/Tfp pilus assembly protein PilF